MQHVAFDCPPLGPTATDHWNDASVEACVETIQAVEAVRAYPVYGVYTDPASGASMTLHAGHEPGNDANYSMCGHTQLRASLAEAAACFQRLNTHEADAFVAMLGRPILGSTTLYTLMEPSEESPMQYTGIEWTAFEAPRLGDSTPIRDLCYLESQNQFFHQGEQRHGWVRSLHSIEVDACPPFAQDIYRAEIYQSGQVFVQSATPGVLDCYSLCSIDLKYTLPEPDHMTYLTKWVTQMLTLHTHIATQRAACARAVHSAVQDSTNHFVCPTCDETLAPSKATCRECDRPICEKCHPKWSLTSMWRRLNKSQVCVECSEELRGVSLLERNTTSESWECTTRSTIGSAASTETMRKRPSSLVANYVASARDLETVWIDVSSVDSSAAQTPTGDDIPVARAAKPRDDVKLHELLDSYHAKKLIEDPRVQQLYKDLVALDRS